MVKRMSDIATARIVVRRVHIIVKVVLKCWREKVGLTLRRLSGVAQRWRRLSA
jgi:hypothetical protein